MSQRMHETVLVMEDGPSAALDDGRTLRTCDRASGWLVGCSSVWSEKQKSGDLQFNLRIGCFRLLAAPGSMKGSGGFVFLVRKTRGYSCGGGTTAAPRHARECEEAAWRALGGRPTAGWVSFWCSRNPNPLDTVATVHGPWFIAADLPSRLQLTPALCLRERGGGSMPRASHDDEKRSETLRAVKSVACSASMYVTADHSACSAGHILPHRDTSKAP